LLLSSWGIFFFIEEEITADGFNLFIMNKTETSANESQFRKIYSDNYAVIMNLINKHIGNFHDSEEICQNLFITMYNKFNEIDNHTQWLRGAVRFEVLSYYRKNNISKDFVSIDGIQEESVQRNDKDGDLSIILREAIDRAENYENSHDKVLFQLIAINKYTYAEAAAELGISRRQAEYAYGKIIQKIVAYLKSKGISTEAFS
jgi:RNA polymerase sigma factor (sigma-70 family)